MARFLMKKGFVVSFADDGEEFLKVLQASRVPPGNNNGGGGSKYAAAASAVPFEAILVDRHLAKLEGPEAIRWDSTLNSLLSTC